MDSSLRNALAAFEAFRRLGFESEKLFFIQDERSVFMSLHDQDKEFTIYCGPKTGSKEEVEAAWIRNAEAWNEKMTHEDRAAIWDGSFISKHCAELVTGLVRKGFVLRSETIKAEAKRLQKESLH